MDSQRKEEFEVLQAIYGVPSNTESLEITRKDESFTFTSSPLKLVVHITPKYPQEPPTFVVHSCGIGVSRMQIFQFQMLLNDIAETKVAEMILFDLTEETREFASQLRGDLSAAQTEEEQEEEDKLYLYMSPYANAERSDERAAKNYLGHVTIVKIMERLPCVRLLHAELVLRPELQEQFDQLRRALTTKYTRHGATRKWNDQRANSASKIEIVFHGSPRQNVSSIVQSGFVIPGQKTKTGEAVSVRCGSTWGRGTYTSPDPSFCLSYTDYTAKAPRLLPGQKIIVCAALPGRSKVLDWSEICSGRSGAKHGYDSHISPSKLEYITFDPAQLLPLYVLHIESSTHTDAGWNFPGPAAGGAVVEDPKDIQMDPTHLTNMARKHFPFGFGAGKRFVVLEIADVDDDEEAWGDYQDYRYNEVAGNPMDEFQDRRWSEG